MAALIFHLFEIHWLLVENLNNTALAPTAKQDCTLRNAISSRKGLGPFSITEAPKSCLITEGYQDSVVRTPGFSQESPHMG